LLPVIIVRITAVMKVGGHFQRKIAANADETIREPMSIYPGADRPSSTILDSPLQAAIASL
jgi:hypothetical protein